MVSPFVFTCWNESTDVIDPSLHRAYFDLKSFDSQEGLLSTRLADTGAWIRRPAAKRPHRRGPDRAAAARRRNDHVSRPGAARLGAPLAGGEHLEGSQVREVEGLSRSSDSAAAKLITP